MSAYPRRHFVPLKKDAWSIQHGINIYSKIISILYDLGCDFLLSLRKDGSGGFCSRTNIHKTLHFNPSAKVIRYKNSHRENVDLSILVTDIINSRKFGTEDPIK